MQRPDFDMFSLSVVSVHLGFIAFCFHSLGVRWRIEGGNQPLPIPHFNPRKRDLLFCFVFNETWFRRKMTEVFIWGTFFKEN